MRRSDWMQRCVGLILRSRWPTLAVVVAVAAVAGFYATKITLDTSLETWFLEDHASLVGYKEFRGKFGEDQFVVLAIETENVFTPEILGELQRLTKMAEEVPHVRSVTSLTNVEVLRRIAKKVLPRPLMKQLPTSQQEAAQLGKEAASNPLIAGNLVSRDGRMAAVVVELSHGCDTFQKKAEVVRELAGRSADHRPDIKIRLAGTPVVSDAISRYLEKDLSTLIPAAFAVVVVATFLLFRRFSVALISFSVVGLASITVLGVMGMLGIKMNLLGPVLILIILVVGVADSIHIFSAYFQELQRTETRDKALDRALTHMLLPCFVTSLTTIAGFLSLFSSDLEPIRHFGALAALGTAVAFLISVFLIPALVQLHLVPGGKPRKSASNGMDRLLGLLGRPSMRVASAVLVLATVIMVPAVWLLQFIEVTANPMNYFHPDDPIRSDAEAVDEELGGAASLEFIVRAADGGMKRLDVLKRLDKFETYLRQLPAVTQVTSFATYLKEVDRVRHPGRGPGRLPRSDFDLLRATRIMQLTAPDLLDSQVQDDFSLGRISVRVKAIDADRLASLAPDIENWVVENVEGPDLKVEGTGFVKLMDDMRNYLIRSQVTSVILAFAAITLLLCALFRSWKLALFSMIPNVGPIVMGLALMSVLDIRLDPGTVMIATIALGLVVDDTCHFLVRLRTYVRRGMDLRAAIAETMKRTGRPIILTSIILSSGFAVLLLGSFTPTVSFGLVSAFVLLTALVADLVVLPATLLILRPKL